MFGVLLKFHKPDFKEFSKHCLFKAEKDGPELLGFYLIPPNQHGICSPNPPGYSCAQVGI